MGRDVAAEVAGGIAGAKVFGSSDIIRHGIYNFKILRIWAEEVDNGKTKANFGFWLVSPISSLPNPQVEGDVDPATGKLKDDGTRPNLVGSECAMKLNFTGNYNVASSNMKAAIMALFNMNGDVSEDDVFDTWMQLANQRFVRAGEVHYYHPKTHQPVHAKRDLIPNPACGMIIDCSTRAKKKAKPNEKGAYVTELRWKCAHPIGEGENAPDKVAARRAEIEAQKAIEDAASGVAAPTASAAPPPPPSAAAAPPPPPATFAPTAPWVAHPTHPGYFWSNPQLGGTNAVKSEAELRAGQ